MGAALAMGAAGAVGSSVQQARAAEEQARVAQQTTQADIAAREMARQRAGALSQEAVGHLGAYQDAAAQALRGYGQFGLEALGQGRDASSALLAGAGERALGGLASGYGQAAQGIAGGYGQAAQDWASMQGPADVVGASGIMGLSDAGMRGAFGASPEFAGRFGAGLESAMGAGRGLDQAKLEALVQYGAGGAAQGYGDFAAREMAGRGMGLGAMQAQAARDQAMAQAQASGLASLASMGGQSMGDYLGAQAQSLAGQEWGMGQGLAQLESQRAAERYAAMSGLGTQLGSLLQGAGSNIAGALTGQAQLGANLATGIDRSGLVSAAGQQQRDSASMWRDLGQLGFMLGSRGSGSGGGGETFTL